MIEKKWLWEEIDKNQVLSLCEEYNISTLTAEILIKRGISKEDIPAFLDPKIEHLASPFKLKDMDSAVERIRLAISKGEKILIFGDYDVDGITSTTVLFKGLESLGAQVSYYIPNRDEGYGLNKNALQKSFDEGVSLVITVDCGISAVDEVQFCNENDVDLIITDHHLPPEVLPNAYAIINPKQQGCNYEFKELAGVGLSFKLTTALYQSFNKPGWEDYLDIVALGTVADLVPLLGENRTIVSLGLQQMKQGLRLPFKKLAEVAGAKPPLDSYHLGFAFGPRLNAAGRLESPKEAIELLLATDGDKALALSESLNQQNKERQEIEQEILDQCISMVEEMNLAKNKVLVLGNDGWHHGVIGIVASRLVEKYHRPVIMLAIKGEHATGSCRSVEGFHLYEALDHCSDLLVKFGGHAMAAGLTIEKKLIEKLNAKINKYAEANNIDRYLVPKLNVDMTLDPYDLDLKLISEINKLKPFGQGNPAPVFRISELDIYKFNLVGQQKNHLKVDFKLKNMWIPSIGFKKADLVPRIFGKKTISFAGYLDENTFNGNTNLQLRILDLKDEKAEKAEEIDQDTLIDLIDIRHKSFDEYLNLMRHSNIKYIIYTNRYHKKRLEDFYLDQQNVIIKEYGDIDPKGIPVFLHLPFRQSHFKETLDTLKEYGTTQMILAINQEDTHLVPSRECLVAIYKAIRQLNQEGKEANLTNINSYLDGKFSVDYLVDRGLNIFSECNLLQYKDDCWYLTDVKDTVDYKESDIYQKYLKQHEHFKKWSQFALSASLQDLMSSQQFTIEEELIWI